MEVKKPEKCNKSDSISQRSESVKEQSQQSSGFARQVAELSAWKSTKVLSDFSWRLRIFISHTFRRYRLEIVMINLVLIGIDTCERGGLGEAITAVDFSDNTVS